MEVYKIMLGTEKGDREKLSSLSQNTRTCGLVDVGAFKTDEKKHFFTQCTARLWNWLPQEVVVALKEN